MTELECWLNLCQCNRRPPPPIPFNLAFAIINFLNNGYSLIYFSDSVMTSKKAKYSRLPRRKTARPSLNSSSDSDNESDNGLSTHADHQWNTVSENSTAGFLPRGTHDMGLQVRIVCVNTR